MDRSSAHGLAAGILNHLRDNDAQIQVVVAEGTSAKRRHMRILGKKLASQRHRVSVTVPSAPQIWAHLGEWLDLA